MTSVLVPIAEVESVQARLMVRSIREILEYWNLLSNLVARDLKVRYKRSVLGVLWTMLNPLLMMTVFSIVFANVFRFSFENFTIYFLSAFLVWTFVSQATSWSTACLLGYAPLIRRIYVPKVIFVLATVLSGLLNLLLSLIPLTIIMLCVRHPFSLSLAFLPVSIVIALCFALGVSLLLASVCIEFHDVIQIYQVGLVAWMYLTPIIYPLEIVPERYRWVIFANPLYYVVEVFRAPIYAGVLPESTTVLYSTLWALGVLGVGWWVFDRRSDRIAYLV